MEKKDILILKRIKNRCEEIDYLKKRFGAEYETFIRDRAYFNAVLMCVMQISGFSGELSADFRSETSRKIPWSGIIGIKNAAAHDHGTPDEELLWETVVKDVPALAELCASYPDRARINTAK